VKKYALSGLIVTCLLIFFGPLAAEVTQDLGFRDVIYQDLTAIDCRDCHGTILYERHHVSDTGQAGDCLACHTVSGGYLQTESNCLVCHPQTGIYSPHHDNQEANDGECANCHQANLVTDLQDIPWGDPPEFPGLHTCSEVCHDIPYNNYTHHNNSERICTDCHFSHGASTFWGCKGCHNELTLHNIAPHRDACADCHGGVVPDSTPPSEPVNPGILAINPNGTKGADTVLVTGDDFEPFDIDSRIEFDSTGALVLSWGDSAVTAEVPAESLGNYAVRVSNYLGTSNRVGFAITADSPYNPVFGQMDCSTCHADSSQHVFLAPDYTACASCHVLHGDLACAHQVDNNDCTGCHQRNLWPEHDDNCDLCHESTDPTVIQAIADGNTTCTACHSTRVHLMNCELCHDDKTWEDYIGREDEVHPRHMDRMMCGICHAVPTEPVLEPTGQYCDICHDPRPYNQNEIPDIHKRHVRETRAVPYQCMACHGRTIADHVSTDCSLCHDNQTYPGDWSQSRHQDHAQDFDCTACHQHPRDFTFILDDACVNCHNSTVLTSKFGIHQNQPYHINDPMVLQSFSTHKKHKGKTQCWACHGSDDITQQTSGFQCINCHGDTPSGTMLEVHQEHAGDAYMCWVCHDRMLPIYTIDLVNEPPDCP